MSGTEDRPDGQADAAPRAMVPLRRPRSRLARPARPGASDEIRLLEGLSEGVPLRALCRELGLGRWIVYRWIEADPGFAARVAQARMQGHDALAEEALEIADASEGDWKERERGSGGPVAVTDHIQRAKLRVDTRLRLLAKWDPRRYGEATLLKHADAEGGRIDLAKLIAERRATVAAGRAAEDAAGTVATNAAQGGEGSDEPR
ncbi:terminase [Nostoc sp. 3335mG]|nr:terminase [Nostoc sp. 3335mG]